MSAREKVMGKGKIIVKEQEQGHRDCRSHWVVADELLEKKHARFYTRNNRARGAVYKLPRRQARNEDEGGLCVDTFGCWSTALGDSFNSGQHSATLLTRFWRVPDARHARRVYHVEMFKNSRFGILRASALATCIRLLTGHAFTGEYTARFRPSSFDPP
jgi:hypothetical protein